MDLIMNTEGLASIECSDKPGNNQGKNPCLTQKWVKIFNFWSLIIL